MTEAFVPEHYVAFRFTTKSINWGSSSVTVEFAYRLETDGRSEPLVCVERFEFPIRSAPDEHRREAFDRLTNHLGLIAGLSYYKLAAPAQVLVDVGVWTPAQLSAHQEILANGLGEFCFVNGLDPNLRPTYSATLAVRTPPPVVVVLDEGSLVPVGGGKDSCVSIEALRRFGIAPTLITVNRYPVIAEVIADAGLNDIAVQRILDPQMRDLNERGARNGHVPATAIVSLAVACAAVLNGYDAVVMSNERSASEGNVSYRGYDINHQWSKSADAEQILRSLIQSEVSGLAYFSLLRPLSELAIARAFAETCERYLESFSSCNAAFRLDPARRVSRWCGQCPKCQFVYLALATSLSRAALQRIWGAELFDTSPREGFLALLGLTEWKPFECVGESGECRVALAMLSESPEWGDHDVVVDLAAAVRAAGKWPTIEEHRAVFEERHAPEIPIKYVHIVPVGE